MNDGIIHNVRLKQTPFLSMKIAKPQNSPRATNHPHEDSIQKSCDSSQNLVRNLVLSFHYVACNLYTQSLIIMFKIRSRFVCLSISIEGCQAFSVIKKLISKCYLERYISCRNNEWLNLARVEPSHYAHDPTKGNSRENARCEKPLFLIIERRIVSQQFQPASLTWTRRGKKIARIPPKPVSQWNIARNLKIPWASPLV